MYSRGRSRRVQIPYTQETHGAADLYHNTNAVSGEAFSCPYTLGYIDSSKCAARVFG